MASRTEFRAFFDRRQRQKAECSVSRRSATVGLSTAMLNNMADSGSRARIRDDWKDRRLRSDRRTGRYARSKALRRQEQFIRHGWPYLVALLILPGILLPGVWLMRPAYRGLLIGLIVPIGPWLAAGTVVIFSGASSLWMGRLGEIWTADELRRARRSGWTFANDVFLASQIDHVALGPAGVLVIETKWSADPWKLDDPTDWRRRAALSAVKDQATHVRSLMRNRRSEAPVVPVVVQWGPPGDTDAGAWLETEGAVLVAGSSFRSWLESLPTKSFDPQLAKRGWDAVLSHIEPRDRYVEATEGPAPRTVGQLYWLIAKPILLVFGALYSAASTAKLFKGTDALIAVVVVASLGFLTALSHRLRRDGLLWGISILLAYTLAIIVVLARHAI